MFKSRVKTFLFKQRFNVLFYFRYLFLYIRNFDRICIIFLHSLNFGFCTCSTPPKKKKDDKEVSDDHNDDDDNDNVENNHIDDNDDNIDVDEIDDDNGDNENDDDNDDVDDDNNYNSIYYYSLNDRLIFFSVPNF